MCGIAGILALHGQSVLPEEVRAMCDALRARGPDDEGYFVNGQVGLGMRRLSIIDLATGHQPVSNEDGSVHLVLNGEIYNYRELRRDLVAAGHRFATSSDTEVIVHLYEQYGEDCVHHLRGMFAFALWDEKKRKLLVARDRLGIKPLYYGQCNGHLIFGSELKALLQLQWVERNLDWGAVANLFTFLTTPATQSIIAGIHKLPPGHLLALEEGCPLRIRRYWDVRFQPDATSSEAELVEKLRALLAGAVEGEMVSDVPVGAFLSGGLDSSSVVAHMSRLSPRPVKTFTIGFAEPAYNEAPYAREVAQALGTEHHELLLEPDVLNMLDDLAWDLDEPFGDSSAIPTYMVSKLAAEHVKVVLSGDGGDELFAGYDKYRVERRERRYRYVPRAFRLLFGRIGNLMQEGWKGRNFLRHMALDGSERYLHAAYLFDHEGKSALFKEEVSELVLTQEPWREMARILDRSEGHWLSALQYLDLHYYLPLDILTKVDRMSMANSLEARVPLLDHRLVEFAATIPPHLQLQGERTKHLFKQAMRGVLPDSIIDRKKHGFAVPLSHWFRGELNSFVRDLLLAPTSRARNIFNPNYIEKLLELQQRGRAYDLQLWTLISFELWCRTFLDRPVRAAGRGTTSLPAAELQVPAPEFA
jgi:asparagine synthase (glutamine-hydrolyzing)